MFSHGVALHLETSADRAIQTTAKDRGVSVEMPNRRYSLRSTISKTRAWSRQEEERLRARRPRSPTREVVKAFGRSTPPSTPTTP